MTDEEKPKPMSVELRPDLCAGATLSPFQTCVGGARDAMFKTQQEQRDKEMTFGEKCGFYKCWARKGESGYCDDHNNKEDIQTMHYYRGLREEGHSQYSAALQAGLDDPQDPDEE